MSIRIISHVTSGPLWVPLTSGEHLRLAPGQTSPERPDVDVADNPTVDSMVERGVIEVVVVDDPPRSRGGGKKNIKGSVPVEATGDEQQK